MDKTQKSIKAVMEEGQREVELSKFGPFLEYEHISRAIRLPTGYNKDRIVAMVRDPWWVFVYWEITPQREASVLEELKRRGLRPLRTILRVYDITGVRGFDGNNANSSFDITINNAARNWYIDVGSPGRTWCIAIGILAEKDEFYILARSNIVNTPRFGMSDILDETWMLSEEEYYRIFGASCGLDVVGKSSFEIKELFKRHLMEWISSGGITSFASHILRR